MLGQQAQPDQLVRQAQPALLRVQLVQLVLLGLLVRLVPLLAQLVLLVLREPREQASPILVRLQTQQRCRVIRPHILGPLATHTSR